MLEESESKKQTEAEVQRLQHDVNDLSSLVAGLQEDVSVAEASLSRLQQELDTSRCSTIH